MSDENSNPPSPPEAPMVNKFQEANLAARMLKVKTAKDFVRLVELANEAYGLSADNPDLQPMDPGVCARWVMAGVEKQNKEPKPDFEKLSGYDLVFSVVGAYAQQQQRKVDQKNQVAFLNVVISVLPKDSEGEIIPLFAQVKPTDKQ
jgi:aspartyl/asparaginyl beta-hydroxylase (cupin superfamily)